MIQFKKATILFMIFLLASCFAACCPSSKEMGVIYRKDVYEAGVIKNTAAMQEAYKMGKEI